MASSWYKRRILLFGISAVMAAAGCRLSDGAPGETLVLEQTAEAVKAAEEQTESASSVIFVHICGAVAAPGVYGLPEGSRLMDAVNLAGGFAEGAADAYLNLAACLTDGEKIVIPYLTDVAEDVFGQKAQEEENSGLININTAGLELLMTLPGIGETRAKAILAYREIHGDFNAVEDIMLVSGIKNAAFEKIKDYITVEP